MGRKLKPCFLQARCKAATKPWIAIMSFFVGLAGIFLKLSQLLPPRTAPFVFWGGLAVSFLSTLILYFQAGLRSLHRLLCNTVPWLVLAILVLSGAILSSVMPRNVPISVPFDSGKGALFNSTDHHPEKRKHIWASGGRPHPDAGPHAGRSHGVFMLVAPMETVLRARTSG